METTITFMAYSKSMYSTIDISRLEQRPGCLELHSNGRAPPTPVAPLTDQSVPGGEVVGLRLTYKAP